MERFKGKYGFLALLLISVMLVTGLVMGAATRLGFIRLAPISTYQGIHPSFVAVYHENEYYTTETPGEASVCSVGPASLNFDPDHNKMHHPNLQGELRDIQIIKDLSIYIPEDAYTHIINKFGGNPQPDKAYRVHTWEVVRDDKKHIYQMELWLCSMEVNLWAKPDYGGLRIAGGEAHNQRYQDTEVWLRLEPSNAWGAYFADADDTYFGLAYMELAQLTGSADDPYLQVIPMAKWAAFDVYDRIGGLGETPDEPDAQAFSYQNTTLNPEVFRREWFTKVVVSNFGTYAYKWYDGSFKSDTVQFKVLVHVFVVGEWVVKPDIERDMEEHVPPWKRGWLTDFIFKLQQRFKSPFDRLIFAGLVALAIIVLLLFLRPELIMTAYLFYKERKGQGRQKKGGRRKKRGKK